MTAERRRSEQSLALLVESVRDYAIFLLDPHGHIQSWNTGASRIKLYQDAEIIGRHFSVFYTAEDQAAGLPALGLRRAAAEGRYEAEGWRVRKDGTLFWANVVITAVHDEQGQLVGFGKVTRDLTERKRAEETHIQLLTEQAARGAAEAALRDREAFLSVAAHELRTPITSLKGFTVLSVRQLDRPGPLDVRRLRRALETVDRQAGKVAALIDELLELSRLQLGKLALQRAPTDLVALVQDAVVAAQMQTSQHTLTVRAPRTLEAWVDALRLLIEQLGGAVRRVEDGETAFAYRDAEFDFLISAVWDTPAETEANVGWARRLFEAMRPSLRERAYVNYLGAEDADRVQAAYGAAKYARLVALKNRYDPANIFCFNQNIRPS